jgi:hypothetical protein
MQLPEHFISLFLTASRRSRNILVWKNLFFQKLRDEWNMITTAYALELNTDSVKEYKTGTLITANKLIRICIRIYCKENLFQAELVQLHV